MTRKQLERFVTTRNKSPHFSNLQFQIDAETCGFKVIDLPDPVKIGEDHYEWHTSHGVLTEQYRKMSFRE